MSCNNNYNSAYYKSAQTAYNNAAQTLVVGGTTIAVLGSQVCDTGCSIDTSASGFTILHTGLYRISYDVVLTAGTAGTAVLQLYNGTTTLPCGNAQVSAAADDIYTLHAETVIPLSACANIKPAISAMLSGVTGTINHVCASVVRLA